MKHLLKKAARWYFETAAEMYRGVEHEIF